MGEGEQSTQCSRDLPTALFHTGAGVVYEHPIGVLAASRTIPLMSLVNVVGQWVEYGTALVSDTHRSDAQPKARRSLPNAISPRVGAPSSEAWG